MNAERIQTLMGYLGVFNSVVMEKWVKGSCPFAWSRHAKGKDSNPSFGITIEPTGRSHYNCFSCHSKGDLAGLLMELMHEKRKGGAPPMNLKAAFEMIEQENDEAYYDAGEWTPTKKVKQFEAWPEWFLDQFAPASSSITATKFLNNRGLSADDIKKFDLRFDAMKQRICFPFRTKDGQLAGMRGRHIDRKHFHDYTFNDVNNTALMLYNEDKADTSKPVVLVEGDFDVINTCRGWPNTLGMLGSYVTPYKIEKLVYFPEVIIFTDADKAGHDAAHGTPKTKGIYDLIAGFVPTYIVEYPKQVLEAHGKNEAGDWLADPGNLSIEELKLTLKDYVDI